MARGLTQKQETFCLKYFELGNASEAALIAGYSPRSIRNIASTNLTKTNIKERLQSLRQAAEDATVATVLERKQVLSEIVRGRFVDFMHNLTAEKLKSAALQEIRITEFTGGKEGRAHEKTTTIKLHNPIQAIFELNKMERIYSDGSEDKPVKVQVNVLNVDAKTVAAAILEAEKLGLTPGLLGGNGHGEDAPILSSPADIQATPVSEPQD